MDRTRALLLISVAMIAGSVLVAAGGFHLPNRGILSAASARPYAPPGRLLAPAEIEALFRHPRSVTTSDGPVSLSVHELGELRLPSGRIVASDAFGPDAAFTTVVPPGAYPVLLLRADSEAGGAVNAAALLRVADGVPVRWTVATLPGQDASTLGPDEVFTYPVDSGTGCFTSAEFRDAAVTSTAWMDELIAAFRSDPIGAGEIVVLPPGGADAPNLVAFDSGYGDGRYPSFFGLDAAGNPIALLTDFGLLDAVP